MKSLFTYIFIFISISSGASNLDSITELYNTHEKSLHYGVNQVDEWLFVKVRTSKDAVRNRSFLSMKSMLQVKSYLKDFYDDSNTVIRLNFPHNKDSDFAKETLRRIKAKSSNNFSFQSSGHVLDNNVRNNFHEYLVAVPFDSGLKEGTTKILKISDREWLSYLKNYRSSVLEEADDSEEIKFYEELGSMEDSLSASAFSLVLDTTLENYPVKKEEDNSKVKSGEQSSIKWCFPDYKRMLALSKKHYDAKEYSEAVLLDMMAIPVAGQLEVKLDRLQRTINGIAVETRSNVYNEYASLIDLYIDYTADYKNILAESSLTSGFNIYHLLSTFGHVSFNSSISSDVTQEYKQAMSLFQKGKNINKIVNLLNHSIEISPAHPDSYRLLGAALVAKKDYLHAILSLNQAIFLEQENGVTKANLAKCYKALKLNKLAVGMAWSSLIAEERTEWSESTALKILRNIHNNK